MPASPGIPFRHDRHDRHDTSRARRRKAMRVAIALSVTGGTGTAVSMAAYTGPAGTVAPAEARFAEAVVMPAHARLVAASAALRAAATSFERSPQATNLRDLHDARLAVAVAWAGQGAFAFGPVHSLGHDVALDFPTDEAGVDRLVAGLGDASLADIEGLRLIPSLTGLQTIDYLLRSRADAARFTPGERRYLHALALRIERVATGLAGTWAEGHDGRPAYAAVLANAGGHDNAAYRSAAGAAEEIVRGLVEHLDVVLHEALPDAIERERAGLSGQRAEADALAVLAAAVDGVARGHAGAWTQGWIEDGEGGTVHDSLLTASNAIAEARDATEPAPALAALERATPALERGLEALSAELGAMIPPTIADAADAPDPRASADRATAWNRTSSAYEEAPPNLGARGAEDHELGDEAFEESFVSTLDHPNAGLGPTFNNTSCVACHVRNGRGMPVAGQLLLRVSDALPGGAAALDEESDTLAVRGNTPPVTGLGNQIQDFGIVGEAAEAHVDIRWSETVGEYPDGTAYSLRSPTFEIVLASTGESLPDSVRVSPRVPPPVYGLGLLEAIDEADILALADPDDADGDGISGRPNLVWNERLEDYSLGRFGWKANSPNLRQQTADAYLNDMGVHSPMFPAEDGSTEIDEATLHAATAYSQTLAVPARAGVHDEAVRRGEALFASTGCTGCHVQGFETGPHEYPALSGQRIRPYTDLLLHDMGEGLADDRPDFEASGREWRTPALWGIGLAQTVLPYSGYLHDGRARTLEEAILWHGGEAERARRTFEGFGTADRRALVSFLQSL